MIPLTGDDEAERTTRPRRQAATPRRKLLFLLPFAPDVKGIHGGTRATGAMIDMLGEHHRVCVLYLVGGDDPVPRQLPAKCERLVAVEKEPTSKPTPLKRTVDTIARIVSGQPRWVRECWTPTMAAETAAIAAEFMPDIVHFEFHVMAQYIPVVRSACPQAACIVTEHEPGITADAGRGAVLTFRQRLGRLVRHRAWSRYERRMLRIADAIIVFTPSDAAALEHLLGASCPPVTVIPLRLPSGGSSLASASAPVRSDFVFVGNFRHPPNADAARRLLGSIFPAILRQLPEARLAIVGTDPPQDLVDAASDRVTVTGWVDDPSVYLAGASVVLVPLRQGGGMRVKMLEACAAGKAIVASRMAVEGLSLRHGEQVMLAQTDKEFARTALALMADPEARARLESACRGWWQREHDAGRWSIEYADFYSALDKR